MKNKIVAIIQARMGSTRLPGKVLKDVENKPILEILVNRTRKSKILDEIVIATTTNDKDTAIINLANKIGINSFRGSEKDVLNRYVEAARFFDADLVIRITSDNPLIDPRLIDEVVTAHLKENADFTFCNDTPIGLDLEVINLGALKIADENASLESEREHVTVYLYKHPGRFKILNYKSKLGNEDLRLTVDTEDDLTLMRELYQNLGDLEYLETRDVIGFLMKNEDVSHINRDIKQAVPEEFNFGKIVFLTEGSHKIGMGHVCLSLTLAKKLSHENGPYIHFIVNHDLVVSEKIMDYGFDFSPSEDDEDTINKLDTIKPDLVIINRIDVAESLLMEINRLNMKIMILDHPSPHSPAIEMYVDMIINAFLSDRFVNENYIDKKKGTKYFYGPKYLLLRNQFYEYMQKKRISKDKIGNILIIFGGGDPSNLTIKLLEILTTRKEEFQLNVVLGPQYLYYDSLNRFREQFDDNRLKIHKDIKNVAKVIHNSDLIITSPGNSMLEAMSLNVPTIAICQNDAQRHYYKKFKCPYLLMEFSRGKIIKILSELSNRSRRESTSKRYKKMEIGKGKDQIVRSILTELSKSLV